MDKGCLKKSRDFLFPEKGIATNKRCVPKLLIKSSYPSEIRSDKIKLATGLSVDVDQKYSFICSLIEVEDWLSNKMEVANCLFDVADFSSCRNPLSNLPTKETRYVGKRKNDAATVLMTPARILTNKEYDILDFQAQNLKRQLKRDDYYGIIYKWIKKKT